MRHFEWFSNNVESTLLCLWSTYREVDIGNWWSSCHQNLDNLCMSCPCCQVKWAGTLVVGAITRGFIAKQQLHDVSVKTKKGEWLKKENSKPNFSSLWNSNTNASCIFFLLMDSEVGRGVGVAHYSKSPFLVQKIHFKIYKTEKSNLGRLNFWRLDWVEKSIFWPKFDFWFGVVEYIEKVFQGFLTRTWTVGVTVYGNCILVNVW